MYTEVIQQKNISTLK